MIEELGGKEEKGGEGTEMVVEKGLFTRCRIRNARFEIRSEFF